jgi:hypothetical protein
MDLILPANKLLMEKFTITFKYNGIYFTSLVKSKKQEFSSLFALKFENEYPGKELNIKGLIFVDNGGKSLPIVYYPHYIKKDCCYEKVVWDAIHEVHDRCFFYGSNPTQFPSLNLS